MHRRAMRLRRPDHSHSSCTPLHPKLGSLTPSPCGGGKAWRARQHSAAPRGQSAGQAGAAGTPATLPCQGIFSCRRGACCAVLHACSGRCLQGPACRKVVHLEQLAPAPESAPSAAGLRNTAWWPRAVRPGAHRSTGSPPHPAAVTPAGQPGGRCRRGQQGAAVGWGFAKRQRLRGHAGWLRSSLQTNRHDMQGQKMLQSISPVACCCRCGGIRLCLLRRCLASRLLGGSPGGGCRLLLTRLLLLLLLLLWCSFLRSWRCSSVLLLVASAAAACVGRRLPQLRKRPWCTAAQPQVCSNRFPRAG